MKTALVTLALAAFAATASNAMVLSNYDSAAIKQVAPNVDLTNLSDGQVHALSALAAQGDLGSQSSIRAHINSIVSGNGAQASRYLAAQVDLGPQPGIVSDTHTTFTR